MSFTDLKPDYVDSASTFQAIQKAVDKFDIVNLHPRDSKGKLKSFNIGANNILVTKPTKIIGILDGRNQPVITGSSGWMVFDDDKSGKPRAGIFTILGPKGPVEINDLRLEHTPGLNPLSPSTPLSMHGSATIACFVDSYPLNIAINHCRIITAATTAISFDAINSPYSTTPAKKHSVKVTNCTISGRVHPLETWPLDSPIWDKLELLFGLQTMRQLDPGNYIGVKLGALHPGQKPIDMSGSVFEVSGCTIDSGKWAGVSAGFLKSDQSSVFRVVSKNYIGYHPNSSLEGTRVGVIFMNGSVIHSSLESWAKGTIDVNSNYIKLQKYFPFPPPDWSTGILVRVNSALAQTNTTINHNEVEFTQSTLPSWPAGTNPTDLLMDGILYQDDKEPLVSANAKVFITDNVLVSPTVKPLRGISLMKRAHDVMVTNNNLTKLTASHAQIYVDPEAYNCNVSGNVLAARAKAGTP